MPQSSTRRNLSATHARNLRTLLLASVFEPDAIGTRIAQARREAGLTQEELADLVGVSTRSLQSYEAGNVVPYKHIRKLAKVLKRQVEWFLHGDVEPDPEHARLREELEAEVARFRKLGDQIEAELKRLQQQPSQGAH